MDRYVSGSQVVENGLWDWDLTTDRIHYSAGWISMLGWGGTEFGNSSEEWFGRIHPEDAQSVQSEINAQLVHGASQFEIQHRMLHQDGCYRWMVCRGMISRDSSGQPTRIRGFHIDTTNEKVVDAVTGLPNRLLLLDRLARSIEKAKKREDFVFAVLVVDLDLFESGVNHLETVNTDPLVTAAARRLETALRTRDVSLREGRAHLIARSGAEEFVVLLDGLCEIGEAKRVAEKLLKEIVAPFDFNGRDVFLSPSIGISLSASKYRTAEEALRDADTALYRAKSFGKCRCEVFDTAAMQIMQNQNQLEQEIQRALNRKEFVVFYQPIVDLSTGQAAGFEALVRWNHPSKGMVPPMEFIPVAEKSALILALDRQVMQQACRQLKLWKDHPRISKDVWVSINLSSNHFLQPTLTKEIKEILLETGLDASSLMLELTEGAVMEDPERTRELLMQLRIMGARVGLDDFGTGYSSLAYLRRFPLDYLKIDHSFIRSIETSADNLEITRAITLLSRQLGLRVIAEGIETPGQLEIVRSLECEYGQGYLFSRAVDSHQAEKFLLEGFIQGEQVQTSSPEASLPSPASSQRGSRRLLVLKKNLLFWGLSLCLLMALGLFAFGRLSGSRSVKPLTSGKNSVPEETSGLPVVRTNPEALSEPMASQALTAVQAKQKPAISRSAAEKGPERTADVYSLPVIHDHVLGNCRGMLSFSPQSISFKSEKDKDSFVCTPSECIYSLEGDRLTIKTGQKVFRFKSAIAQSKDENRSQLSETYGNISRLYTPGPKRTSSIPDKSPQKGATNSTN